MTMPPPVLLRHVHLYRACQSCHLRHLNREQKTQKKPTNQMMLLPVLNVFAGAAGSHKTKRADKNGSFVIHHLCAEAR